MLLGSDEGTWCLKKRIKREGKREMVKMGGGLRLRKTNEENIGEEESYRIIGKEGGKGRNLEKRICNNPHKLVKLLFYY